MKDYRRSILFLLQAAALVVVPLFLEVTWSRQIMWTSETTKYRISPPIESVNTGEVASIPEPETAISDKTPEHPLQIAWLMSFPNSGTTYTSHFVRKVTQTKTATNYAELHLSKAVLNGLETKESMPVYDDQPTGPFWSDGEGAELASGFVLTKTHCGAPCVWCKPAQYTQMIHHFRHRCLRSDKMRVVNGTKTITKTMYPPTRVKKAVHVVRNPLDNVVARFRYEQVIRNKKMKAQSALGFNSTRDDFRTYCKDLNKEFVGDIKRGRYIQPGVMQILQNVPCHAEFMKWVEFHNMAFIVTRDFDLDTFVLHYEDYSSRFDNVTSELLTFLHLKAIEEPPVFEAFKEYKDYYTQEERNAVAFAVRSMSLRETWEHISRYFV